jgi:hypothetical protein
MVEKLFTCAVIKSGVGDASWQNGSAEFANGSMTKKLKACRSVSSLTIGCVLRAASISLFLSYRVTKVFPAHQFLRFFLTLSTTKVLFFEKPDGIHFLPVNELRVFTGRGSYVRHIYYPESCMDR